MPGDPAVRWGFHELDSRAAGRLVAAAGIAPGDLVLDVGAGRGALTAALVDAGARVIAIELHEGRVALLRDRFDGCPVRVVRADARRLRLPCCPFKVVSNPPFAALASVVRRLVGTHSRLQRADLVVPTHAACRWMSWAEKSGGGRGPFDLRLERAPPRHAFHPPPPGAVSLLVVERRSVRAG